MKKQKIKLIILRVILIMLAMIATFFTVFEILELIGKEPVKASNSGNTSDVQLLARAINGEARGEPYEGQVAVRSRYPKPSEKFTISQYHSRSHL